MTDESDARKEDAEAKRPVGRPSLYLPEYCGRVEVEMAEGYSLTAFAGIIGVARSTINEWIDQFPEFSEAVSRAKAKRLVHWEKTALSVAKEGGGPGSATVIVFGLKNMGGDEWADKQEHELYGRNKGPIQSVSMTPEQFEEAARKIAGEV